MIILINFTRISRFKHSHRISRPWDIMDKTNTNEDKWFVLDLDESKMTIESEDKALYRIIPFDSLLKMLNEKTNTLIPIKYWDDVYENFILKEDCVRNGNSISIKRASDCFYGQCWTRKESSDAMWRIYSSDRKSVRIKTRIGKLNNVIPQDENEDYYVLGRVNYYPQSKIEGDLKTIGPITEDQFCGLILQSLFVKRNSFSHESEYRLVYLERNPRNLPIVKEIPIEPLDFIETINFDPRADDSYVERCTKVLTEAFKFPKSRIRKSELYSFKPLRIEII